MLLNNCVNIKRNFLVKIRKGSTLINLYYVSFYVASGTCIFLLNLLTNFQRIFICNTSFQVSKCLTMEKLKICQFSIMKNSTSEFSLNLKPNPNLLN